MTGRISAELNTSIARVMSGAHPPRETAPRRILTFGFAAMLAMMLVLTVVGAVYVGAAQSRLDDIVRNHLIKITLVNEMHAAARERTISLQRMLQATDPFERDEHWLHYQVLAGEFTRAREALNDLEQNDEERALLELQGALTSMAYALHERVADLARIGLDAAARRLLISEATPAQDRVLEQLQAMYALQVRSAAEAADRATVDYRRARVGGAVLAVFMLGMALVVAVAVLRQVRRADAALRQEKERAQVTLHSLGEAVIRTDSGGVIEYLNPSAERLTGWCSAEATGQPLQQVFQIVHDISHEPAPDPVAQALAHDQVVTDIGDLVLVTRAGHEHGIVLTAAPLHEPAGGAAGVVLVFRDVTEMRALTRELRYEATHDAMTRLLNRREFERRLQDLLEEARLDGTEHALCYLDLDMFKVVNDTCGHLAGDELLKQFALLLRETVRKDDVIARIGGDEFTVLLRSCTLDKASRIAEQVSQSLREFRFVWEDRHVDVGASIGVVRVASGCGDLNDVLRAADVACHVAKEEGRNRIHVFRPDDVTVTLRQREINWAQRLGDAVSENRFALYGQWIRPLSRAAGKAAHCEILIRLPDDNGGYVAPAAFLPAAERYHLMPAIDRWVVRNALQALRQLPPAIGARLGTFAINLSGQTLCDREFLPFVLEQLEAGYPSADHLCFEITETAAITNLSSAIRLMSTLRGMGCQFALDDFGTGVSSFAYLKNLPVDFLKIDGAFVRNIQNDATDLAMLDSINQVAHTLGIATIAEYVENEDIRRIVDSLGVDYAQGHALAQSAPLAQLLDELRAG